MGKLIVMEGIDGSGKGSQSALLTARLKRENYDIYKLGFPQYQKSSSFFVRQYLNGEYGDRPDSVSAKQASLCYAMDRFDLFKSDPAAIAAVANPNTILLADRYTTSNILYQATKESTLEGIYSLIDWLCDLEYGVLEIPKPDMVIMPYVEIEKNIAMLTGRDVDANAQANNMKRDIHEQDIAYLRKVHAASEIIAARMGFDVINCMREDGSVRSLNEIHEDIYAKVNEKVLQFVKKKGE